MKVIEELLRTKYNTKDSFPELKRQRKICYPGYIESEYNSLREAVHLLRKKSSGLMYGISELISYNICYRDYLREHGIEQLIRCIVNEAPELAKEPKAIQQLRQWYEKEGKNMAGYDIQCYNIKDTITIRGHEFHGLDDIIAYKNASGRIDFHSTSLYGVEPEKSIPGIYVTELYATYPIFDSFDIGDDRTYQNYFFTSEPVDNEMLRQITQVRHTYNYCMVHENIPEHLLPVLYYCGDGDYMELATKKEL